MNRRIMTRKIRKADGPIARKIAAIKSGEHELNVRRYTALCGQLKSDVVDHLLRQAGKYDIVQDSIAIVSATPACKEVKSDVRSGRAATLLAQWS